MTYNPLSRLSWLLTGMADAGTVAAALIVYGTVAAALWL